jgi:hypothetical protein
MAIELTECVHIQSCVSCSDTSKALRSMTSRAAAAEKLIFDLLKKITKYETRGVR